MGPPAAPAVGDGRRNGGRGLITELCGAKRVGYFGPTQFYIALKLIAAAQSGLPVRIESIKCVSSPFLSSKIKSHFSFSDSGPKELPLPRFMMSKTDSDIRFGNSAELHGTKAQIPYLISEKNTFKRMDDEDKQQETQSPTMSPLASPPSSPPHYQRVPLSHGYSKLRSSTEQMHPAPYEARQPLVQPEGPSSGNQGTKPPRHQASLIRSFSVEREPQDNSNYPDEPWRITEEQREYYVNQFRSLQPDPSSFISGSVAKNFFTKSKLSIPELSYIWELSDADCDGALTLPEFCAAFHLIVARKNGYPLPEGLPPTLQPEYLQAAFPKPKWECALFDSYSESMPANQQPHDLNRMEKLSIKDVADFPVSTQDLTGDDKQALKSTMDEALPKDTSEDPATPKDSNSLKARPRSRSYSSTSIEEAMKRGEDPPTPPPRPQKTHSRASSLDLNKVFQPSVPGQHSTTEPCQLGSSTDILPPWPALLATTCPRSVFGWLFSSISYNSYKLLSIDPCLHPAECCWLSQAGLNLLQLTCEKSAQGGVYFRNKWRPEHYLLKNTLLSILNCIDTFVEHHLTVNKGGSGQLKLFQTKCYLNRAANRGLARISLIFYQNLKVCHEAKFKLTTQLPRLEPVQTL
ncbi:hypothetical protein QTO34_000890 [Cnephaeus nilssonii]|uniref:RalBP1-associated Eps domain-containing protein 2 n=1 Tax=Cnephaeus nilssonii TaxID=3371016 RepID=A0AA40ICG9_CNENI|nr:hypothetical protein QTO34_000890 [Eptesicus nilssonii]